MPTSLKWIGELKRKAKPSLSIEKAKAILILLQKEIDPKTNILSKQAFIDVAVKLEVGKQTVTLLFSELKKALAEYDTLEEYWEAGRPFQYKQPKKVRTGK